MAIISQCGFKLLSVISASSDKRPISLQHATFSGRFTSPLHGLFSWISKFISNNDFPSAGKCGFLTSQDALDFLLIDIGSMECRRPGLLENTHCGASDACYSKSTCLCIWERQSPPDGYENNAYLKTYCANHFAIDAYIESLFCTLEPNAMPIIS